MLTGLRYLFTILAGLGLIIGLGGKGTHGGWGYGLFLAGLVAGYVCLRRERAARRRGAADEPPA